MASVMNLTEAATVEHYFKVNGFSATKAFGVDCIRSKTLSVGGFEWEIHYTLSEYASLPIRYDCWIAFRLVFLGPGPAPASGVKASICCRLVKATLSAAHWRDASGKEYACETKTVAHSFRSPKESSPWALLIKASDLLRSSDILSSDSFTVKCTISVLKAWIDPHGSRTASLMLQDPLARKFP